MSIRQYPQFLRYWIGDTASLWAGNAFQVALYWTLASYAHGAQELGWLSFFSTAPVLGGGPIVAGLFQRFGIRRVMVADFWMRSGVYAALAFWLTWHGFSHLWFIDGASTLWGLTFIANTSGGPSLWPRLLPETNLPLAMKLEQTGWNISAVGGSLTGGLLAMVLPLKTLALIVSGIFFLAGLNLAVLFLPPQGAPQAIHEAHASFRPWSLVRSDMRLWAPLHVFWLSNFGAGDLVVVQPIMVHKWHAPALAYALLESLSALMGTVGTWFWPRRRSTRPLLTRLWLMQTVAGLALAGYWIGIMHPLWAFVGITVNAAMAGGTSIFVMQLRFGAIPEEHRAVVLTHIRTLLQAAGPLGALAAGQWLAHHTLGPAIGGAVLISVVPSMGLLGATWWWTIG
ncbi:hypothetical protein BXT84_00150 [Sulfobacillus thermotolerans]|uniref:MFS transporter n=1 Tax=Sulfobacillus thermotolerans TaxID=338644 RepID=A0ABN5GYB7_9FIRM|nr:hypothetical protein BXT84_00150 [Sulfobacillus thermotolerans]